MKKQQTTQSNLPFMVGIMLAIEKLRVATQVRDTHLKKNGKRDEETEGLISHLIGLEEYVDGRVANIITTHPAWPWLEKVKGIGKENISKVIGPVDIEKAEKVSSLWKFAGFHVDEETNSSPKRTAGKKLEYNSTLRSMCWRLGTSLMRAKGKYYDFFIKTKEELEKRYEKDGIKILPTPPKGSQKRVEPKGVIYKGHLKNQALRKMIKLFLSHLWVVWREGEGLPVTKPYAVAIKGHTTYYDPWDFVDK